MFGRRPVGRSTEFSALRPHGPWPSLCRRSSRSCVRADHERGALDAHHLLAVRGSAFAWSWRWMDHRPSLEGAVDMDGNVVDQMKIPLGRRAAGTPSGLRAGPQKSLVQSQANNRHKGVSLFITGLRHFSNTQSPPGGPVLTTSRQAGGRLLRFPAVAGGRSRHAPSGAHDRAESRNSPDSVRFLRSL